MPRAAQAIIPLLALLAKALAARRTTGSLTDVRPWLGLFNRTGSLAPVGGSVGADLRTIDGERFVKPI
jgi:hypothetical protein